MFDDLIERARVEAAAEFEEVEEVGGYVGCGGLLLELADALEQLTKHS